jgi:nucleoside-diphosphate-sugar epimerase
MAASLAGRRIAVLGGTGFIGSHLVERLVAEGADVLAVGRRVNRLKQLAAVRGSCTVALCDVCDADEIDRTLRTFRPEVVYHLVAHPDGPETFEQFQHCIEVNGLGLVNALRAAAAAGTELFVYGDSTKVYGNGPVPYRAAQERAPLCSYAVVKTAGWDLCRIAAAFAPLHVTAIRPTFVYGPRQNHNVVSHVRDCVDSGQPIRLMGGSQTRDPLYVDDAVAAFAAVPQHRASWGQAIPIGGGSEMTVKSLCEAVLAALGARTVVVQDDAAARTTEVWRSSSDNVDAHRLLEWEPRVSLSDGLARTVAAWADAWPVRSSWFAPAPVAPPTPHGSQFVHEIAPNVELAVLDRRSPSAPIDRRATPRGGRRQGDVAAAPAFAGVTEPHRIDDTLL